MKNVVSKRVQRMKSSLMDAEVDEKFIY